ncbi:hypothetical protein NP493_1016g00017 [Ridgeia piscesae]|uniref:Uncharacterized protein n=1 Tax=Ridgeia piscesae TaxID=27915 RepID=A0AAD9KI97_RIDPI|nr:hypothetical protein NP493_1016g00017 [Ridgeia piscesae]
MNSELAHVHNALRANGYPEWVLAPPPSSAKRPPSTNNNPRRPMLGLLYVAGLSEQLGRIYKSNNIHMYLKPAMVVHPPKDQETKRTLSQRFQEHTNLDKPTGVGDHCRATGHSVSMKNTKVYRKYIVYSIYNIIWL